MGQWHVACAAIGGAAAAAILQHFWRIHRKGSPDWNSSAEEDLPTIVEKAPQKDNFEPGRGFAVALDEADELRPLRSQFHFPHNCKVYLVGNSLGLQPKGSAADVQTELTNWAQLGVAGHFERTSWMDYHEPFAQPMADIVGAKRHEVVLMNGLTVNLHLLMSSFYRPTSKRYKIVLEGGAFPSDRYAVYSRVDLDGFGKDAVIELQPRAGEDTLRTQDILDTLTKHGDSIALVMLSAVQYYSGQYFDMPTITKKAHAIGARCGWDLAHAVGNLPVQLHDWDVDFAVWCNYKYLNGGPGTVGGAFVHEKHSCHKTIGSGEPLPRMAGWWGNAASNRFKMEHQFVPSEGADGWQLSNAPVMLMAPLKASLRLYEHATMPRLRRKSKRLTAYLLYLLDRLRPSGTFTILTPRDPEQRGSQLSIRVQGLDGNELERRLHALGVLTDARGDIVRVSPVPLYNSFSDCYDFVEAFTKVLADM